ncbi:MAG: transmembrane ion channel [Bacteroidetes bacterium]|nr:MAG: transmembrane ion channel [Bacteroidota bacterium]
MIGLSGWSQIDTNRLENNVQEGNENDSILSLYNQRIKHVEQLRKLDSLKKQDLEEQINKLKTTDNLQKDELLKQLAEIEAAAQSRLDQKKAHINSLKKKVKGFPVLGAGTDTLYFIYTKIGASTAEERAQGVSRKIQELYDNDFLLLDSLKWTKTESSADILYRDNIIASISESDALWEDQSYASLAAERLELIKSSITQAQIDNSFIKISIRILLVIVVIALTWLALRLVSKGKDRLLLLIEQKENIWFKDLSYKDYTFLSVAQQLQGIGIFAKLFQWLIYAILFYIALPLIFSIFPFSRNWANTLFQLIWSPFKSLIFSVWDYLPNLFSILVIYFVMRYVIRFVKYIFSEIEEEKLKIAGFHADWSMPTYSIVRFLLYAFMFVLIFPYLPGSDSNIFKGVSVFIGVLFSLGSSSAIANMVAGLVITYMRPFKIGDRIKIGDVAGDVLEKTLLVTRLRTIKNEIITIPNSAVLNGNTTNYTSASKELGLIIHSSVTIGYDVPWPKVHSALNEAAERTEFLLKNPKPFVLQTSLEDFYVAYQINAYTREAQKQALIYSNLHQNIQDVFNEQGIEILSPHYRAARDGNMTTIPADYLPKDYEAPSFKVKTDKK